MCVSFTRFPQKFNIWLDPLLSFTEMSGYDSIGEFSFGQKDLQQWHRYLVGLNLT